ncbi:MAG: amino acid adenylation domain-containing protein, partial [Pseudomonadota bacterium]
FEEQTLSYQVLNTKANQLAHYLMTLGVGAESLVGICVERSLEMVIGLLGILKAGGTYVPLDPDYPKARLAFMLEDTQVPVLLTKEKSIENLPDHQAHLVCLDTLNATTTELSTDNPISGIAPSNLAYVIYTSGSTGKPKGVAVSHRAVNRLVFNTNYINIEPSDRIAHASNVSFDAATFEIWGALLHGARLVGITKDIILSPQEFATYLREQKISIIFLTTALFNQLARDVPDAFQSVQHVLFGGEAVEPRWVNQILKNSPPQRLLHVYGPTENTTFTTWHLVKNVPEGATNIPIGRPIANTQVYLLDQNRKLVPIGVPGELHIGGAGLARGYLNRPNLTAEKFIPNPFSDDPNSCLYKTGDLARYLPDGNIEFLARLDNQVKIRGFRIELGEIEAVLAQHPAVQESVVIVPEESSHDKRLVAYIVPNQGQVIKNKELRSFIKERLPNYMIPSAFVQMETMPLTPNGKIDRRALPDHLRPEPEETFVAPRDKLELQLAKIWEQVLGIQPIGMRDDFFELGGHSLLAVQMFAQIENKLGRNIPLTILFQAPTIEQLSDIIRQKGWSMPWSSLVPIQPNGGKPPLFCVPPAGRTALSFVDLVRHLGTEQPVYGLQPLGMDGKQEPHNRVEDMAAYYIKEIRAFQPEGPYYLAGMCFGGHVAFEMAQQLQKQGCTVALLALLDPSTTPIRPEKTLKLPSYFVRRTIKWIKRGQLTQAMYYFFIFRPYLRLKLWLKKPTNPQERRIQYVYKAHQIARNKYVPQDYPGKITLFLSTPRYDPQDIGPFKHWSKLASGRVKHHLIAGSHREILIGPQLKVLAEQFKVCLDEAQNVHRP